jgi:hypothetical protein
MEEMADPASVVFPLLVAALDRLRRQPFHCLNYKKESGIIKIRDFQISVLKQSIMLATSNNLGPPILTWACGQHDHVKIGGWKTTLLVACSFFLVWAKMT